MVLISASALARMLGSTGKVMSLASSMGAGSERCSVKPSPCCRATSSSWWTASTIFLELALQAIVVAHVQAAGEQGVECLVEVFFCRLQMARLIVGLPGCVLLFGLRDQGVGRIGQRLRLRGFRGGCWRRLLRFLGWRSLRRFSLRRQERQFLGCRCFASCDRTQEPQKTDRKRGA